MCRLNTTLCLTAQSGTMPTLQQMLNQITRPSHTPFSHLSETKPYEIEIPLLGAADHNQPRWSSPSFSDRELVSAEPYLLCAC